MAKYEKIFFFEIITHVGLPSIFRFGEMKSCFKGDFISSYHLFTTALFTPRVAFGRQVDVGSEI